MSTQELHALVDQIRNGPVDFEAPPSTLRATFDGMLGGFPVSDDVRFEAREIGGVPALTSRSTGADERSVLLYLHGGGYVAGSPSAYRSLWSGIAAAAGVVGVAPAYRLAPEHPFPAAIDDALAAYRGLLDEGVEPGAIAVAGDSAGGGLAVALLLAARDAGLPMPSALVLLSPWTDLTCSTESMTSKATADPSLTPAGLRRRAAEYLAGHDATDPPASPVHADLTGLPPTLIHVGGAEILLDDATRLAARAAACGVRVTLQAWPDLVHVFALFGFALSEAREAAEDCAAFVRARTNAVADRSPAPATRAV